LSDLPRLAEWTVPADEIDHIDHMGTAFYAWRIGLEVERLVEGLSGAPGALAAEGLKLLVADRHTHYRKEQRLGAPLVLDGGVTSADGGRFGVYMQMANAETGDLAAMFNMLVEARAVATGAPAPFPASWLQTASSCLVEAPARSRPRSLTPDKSGADLTVADFHRLGTAPHIRLEIRPEACDADGWLRTVKPRFVPENHIPQVGVMSQVWNCAPGYFWPMIEQRDVMLRIPRAGDVLETYEAMLKVDNKAIHSANWVFEAKTGALTEVRHMVTVFFSGETRHAASLPPDLRERFEGLAQPQLLG
jgi:acyl-CoA thioesterase FadM